MKWVLSLCFSDSISRMHFHPSILPFFIVLHFLALGASELSSNQIKRDDGNIFALSIVVDLSGHGNFTKVQAAIDSVRPNSNAWTHIRIKPGIYNEKIIIPPEKEFVFLEGEGRRTTVIQWGDGGSVVNTSTFTLLADNFVARNIAFKNTHDLISKCSAKMTWAPAATIYADKASFYDCSFSSLQDTLSDLAGRHYFESCLIEGAVDFIWGSGQSVYQNCTINTNMAVLGSLAGYITAQGRNSAEEKSGFVFKFGQVLGTGNAFLGRAYGAFSRVIFSETNFAAIIVPEGWSAWDHQGHEDKLTYAEVNCNGPGAGMSKRVNWVRRNDPEVASLIDVNIFINQDGWIQKQPQRYFK